MLWVAKMRWRAVSPLLRGIAMRQRQPRDRSGLYAGLARRTVRGFAHDEISTLEAHEAPCRVGLMLGRPRAFIISFGHSLAGAENTHYPTKKPLTDGEGLGVFGCGGVRRGPAEQGKTLHRSVLSAERAKRLRSAEDLNQRPSGYICATTRRVKTLRRSVLSADAPRLCHLSRGPAEQGKTLHRSVLKGESPERQRREEGLSALPSKKAPHGL